MNSKISLNKTNKYTSYWLVLLVDIIIVLQCFILSYLVRFNFSFDFETSHFFYQIPVVLVVSIASFLISGSYKGVVRHTGQKDEITVFLASSIIAATLILFVLINRSTNLIAGLTIPLSIIVIHYLLNVFSLIVSRNLFRILYHRIFSDLKPSKSVLIYGAGDSGFITQSALVKDTKHHYKIVGFIDDDSNKVGKTIDRVRIYDPSKLNREFILRNRIKEVVVSIQNISSFRLMEITDSLLEHNLIVKIVPPIQNWIDGKLMVGQIQNVRIEDLLDRSPIILDNPEIKKSMAGKTIFVTGAAGSIGSEISRQISQYNVKKLVLIDQAESDLYDLQQEFLRNSNNNFAVEVGNVRDYNSMKRLFNDYNPNIIFHAAAYKHVPLMEENPYEAIRVNIHGTKIVADLSIENNVDKFVFVSTDKAVNPTNIMGATKRVAEMYISSISKNGLTKFITTRFGNVLGSNGSVVPLFKKQLETGGPLTVTHKDITRYFMTIPEACQLVLEAGIMGNGGEIYVFDMGQSVKIYDVAKKMIQLSGLKHPEDVDIKITGLRPGEKLYEELLANNENTLSTHNQKILIAKVGKMKANIIEGKINSLCVNNNNDNNKIKIVKILKELVPEYKSKNSEYEKLDVSSKVDSYCTN